MQCIEDDPMTPDEINWLTWGAVKHRPRGASRWDEPGTHKAITDHCGSWGLDVATEHVLAHARDPKAKTPFVIKGNAPRIEPTKSARQPAKPGADECPAHPGEWAAGCRACAADALAGDGATSPFRPQKAPAEVANRGAAACRFELGLVPEPSPAQDIPASEPADVSAFERPGDVQQRAGEPDLSAVSQVMADPRLSPVSQVMAGLIDRPETACAADGCFRPTRDGICDRCRETQAAEDVRAANAELVERLNANERERAHARPPLDPTAPEPRHFTAADYDPDKVHAAQARAAEQRSTT